MGTSHALHPVYTVVSQFAQLEEISQRSNSTVYQAVCRATGLVVAIKCFRKDALTAKEAVHVAREVHLMGCLRGEVGVVQVLGFFEDDSHAYIVMEHCGGGDVYQRVVLEQRSDEGFAAAGVVAPLLRAVHRLHTRHAIVHRDIKPENVLLTAGGQVRLADFGTAIKQDVEVPFLPVGTLDFMAPEVLGARVPKGAVESPCTTPDMLREHGMAPHDEKVDIWAVGALSYELVVGQPPFYHEDPMETRALILGSALLYFPPHLKGTPFASFVAGAMARDPRRRPSAAQLLRHEWLAQHAHPAGELHRASTLPAPAKPAAADSPSPPAFNIQVVAGGARSDDLNGAAAASEGPAPRAAGLKHSHSESSAALLAAAQKAASLEREQSQAAEGSSLGHAAPQHGGAYSMRRRADSAPAHGAAAALLAQHQRRARRLPLQPASSSSGGDSPREQPTPNSVLHRLNTAASVSMDWLLQAQRAGRPRKPSRLSRSSSSTAAEAPGGGAPGQERGREGEEDDTEDSAGGGSLGSTQGQLGRIKSYLAGQRGHWSRKFSVGRAASSSVLSSASAEGA